MSKNKAAVELGRKRWAGISAAERSEQMTALAKSISSRKASARAKKAWETKRRNAAAINK